MFRFAAQPADKGALEELGVEPICLRTPVLRGTGTLDRWITYASTA
jgi:hypothetical protein